MAPDRQPIRIYLDACCLGRLFDDHTQDRIRLESQAVEIILCRASMGDIVLVGSDILAFEIKQIPDEYERDRLLALQGSFIEIVSAGIIEGERAREFELMGIGPYDALHLACAISAKVDLFLTVDDRFLKKTVGIPMHCANPLEWLLTGKELS